MRSKLQSTDPFWQRMFDDADPDKQRAALDEKIAQESRGIALARKMLPLQHQAGFADYRAALQDLYDGCIAQLIACTASNEYMRVLQGKAQAYGNIIAVMGQQEKGVQDLEKGLTDLQTQRSALDQPQTAEV